MSHLQVIESEMSNVKQLKQFLLDHNAAQSIEYSAAEWSRKKYRIAHPTEFVVLGCMDGRINGPVIMELPPGILQPYRTIGGKFDLGEKRFAGLIDKWLNYSASKQRDCVVFVTYHWSKGEEHRGCKGFKYNVTEAKAFTLDLKNQFERIYGSDHAALYPIRVGVETDLDALVFHADTGDKFLDLSTLPVDVPETLAEDMLRELYPDMKVQVLKDLLQLVMGNIRHIAKTRQANRPVEAIDHQEQILALGRGFSWLHLPNKALIIGPYSYDLSEDIAVAGDLILTTLKDNKKIMEQGAVFTVSAPYRGDSDTPQTELRLAIETAESLARFGAKVIKAKVPELADHLEFLVGTLNEKTLLFTPNDLRKKYL